MNKIFFFIFFYIFLSDLYSIEKVFITKTLLDFETKEITKNNIKTHDKSQAPAIKYSTIFTSPYLLNSKTSVVFSFSNYNHNSFELSLNSIQQSKYIKEIEFHFYNSSSFSGSLYLILEDINNKSYNLLISPLTKKGWKKSIVNLDNIKQDNFIFQKDNFITFKSIIYRKNFIKNQSKVNFFIAIDDIKFKMRKKYLIPNRFLNNTF